MASLWAKKGSASYINAGALSDLIVDYQVGSSAPVTANVSFTFTRFSTVVFAPSSYPQSNWKNPPTPTAGDDYDIRFTHTGGNLNGVLSGTFATWMQLNESLGVSFTNTRNQSGATRARRIILVELRRRSDLVVVYSFTVTMEAEADIS